MQKMEYTVRFLTPAFLGNTEQSGQWRAPPFKALLRQWWRVAVAERHGYDYRKIREEEGSLFGNAWLETGASRSLLRIRLSSWDPGKERKNNWESLPKIGTGQQVDADLYLGYGPVKYDRSKRSSGLKHEVAIRAGESAILTLAVPVDYKQQIMATLGLINCFGTLGGRSRNGWGSVVLEPQDGTPALSVNPNIFKFSMEEALNKDWPHAIGCDEEGLLIWETEQVAERYMSGRVGAFPLHIIGRCSGRFAVPEVDAERRALPCH